VVLAQLIQSEEVLAVADITAVEVVVAAEYGEPVAAADLVIQIQQYTMLFILQGLQEILLHLQ
jgi:hypothetical protein